MPVSVALSSVALVSRSSLIFFSGSRLACAINLGKLTYAGRPLFRSFSVQRRKLSFETSSHTPNTAATNIRKRLSSEFRTLLHDIDIELLESDSREVSSFPLVRTHGQTALDNNRGDQAVQTSCMHAQVAQCMPRTVDWFEFVVRRGCSTLIRQSKSQNYGQRF